jgi:hypothetical protein
MSWSLVNQLGTDFGPTSTSGRNLQLHFPVFAMKGKDGTYLIVDDLAREKSVPFTFEFRTICVDADNNILYDTLANGIDDGFGCLLDNGDIAILRCAKWELLIMSPQGAIVDRLRLQSLSKRPPKCVTWTREGTFLIVFDIRIGELDIVEINRQGQLLWYLTRHADSIGLAGNAQLTEANTILIADPARHVAVEIDRGGRVVWQFGNAKNPSMGVGHLSAPSSINELSDGRRLVCDTRNHRVLLVDVDGRCDQVELQEGMLSDPRFADELPNGNYLICDTGNLRVIEIDRQGCIVWQCGIQAAPRRYLSYPRSVQLIAPDHYLIADTAHDRIVEAASGEVKERRIYGSPGLFWPRCVRVLSGGALLIADGRNHRIVEVSANGKIQRQLSHFNADGPQKFRDPHDVRMLSNGHLLVTDSPHDKVLQVDWLGNLYQAIGLNGNFELNDPHSAQQLDDGRIVVADTGNDRILVVDGSGEISGEIESVGSGSSCLRLNRPRHAEVISEDIIFIADTGNNRVLCATLGGLLVWEISFVPDSPIPQLSAPRWVMPISRDEVVICDHLHHRMLHLRNDPSR